MNRLRDSIAEDHEEFGRIVKGLKRYGGLSADEAMLKRLPRGFAQDHPAGKWLRYQSFTSGRMLADAQVTNGRLPTLLEKEFSGLLPLVRWLNAALGYPTTAAARADVDSMTLAIK